jgi:hypothetical protein
MEATFLGHQTWLITHAGTSVLVDPVLTETFGHSEAISARVFPPRTIDVASMPKIDAIVLSHEHADHFTFESFAALPRKAPVLVGMLMPMVVTDALESMGFHVKRVLSSDWTRIGKLEVRLFAVAMPESFWEQRVTQVYLRPRGLKRRGIYIGVDAALSPFLAGEVERGETEPPRLVVVANNSQIVPTGGRSIYSNPLDEVTDDDEEGPFVGLDLLDALTLSYVEALPTGSCDVAIAGNGFVHTRQPFGPYLLSDNRRLAEIANRLSVRPWVHGPRPGERLVIDEDRITQDAVSWVELDRSAEQVLLEKHRAFRARPTETAPKAVLDGRGDSAGGRRSEVMAELGRLGDMFPFSPLAAMTHRIHEYLGGALGARRFVLRLVADPGKSIQVAYDHSAAAFVPDDTPADKLLETFPFGLELFLVDFLGILDGQLQIWDLDGRAISAWHFGGAVTEGPVALLFAALGEQVRPDLTARIYARALRRLAIEPKRELLERAGCS